MSNQNQDTCPTNEAPASLAAVAGSPISSRLRKFAADLEQIDKMFGGDGAGQAGAELREAADEIDRLRAELAEMTTDRDRERCKHMGYKAAHTALLEKANDGAET